VPLAINLRPKERLIINGVVIQNFGASTKLLIHNKASVLREKDVITEVDANTPARRIYFAIQCEYLSSAKDAARLPLIHRFIQEFESATPSTGALTREIRTSVDKGALYHALKSAKQLIAREQQILHDLSCPERPGAAAATP
jgi:flagellar protein FlbT